MAADRWVGQILGGRYQIEDLLGQGGMSAVYKASDPNLRRVVAIKLIHPHLSDNEEFVRRFEGSDRRGPPAPPQHRPGLRFQPRRRSVLHGAGIRGRRDAAERA